jgi:hypothetical protein
MTAVYPKSGSTWARFLLTYALTGREVSWDELIRLAPYLGRHPGAAALLPRGGRLVKTHDPFHDVMGDPPPRVLYLVRDGRDVAVSYYFHMRRQGRFDGSLSDFVEIFLQGGADNFGPWHEHVLSWERFARRHPERFVRVRYEDLLLDAASTLHAAATSLGLPLSKALLEEAVVAHSAEAMRRREKDSSLLQKGTVDKSIPFVRSAKSGDWRTSLDDQAQQRMVDVAGDALSLCGYKV